MTESAPLLDGFVPWPDDSSERFRALGLWKGESLGDLLRNSAAHYPQNLALICGDRRWRYLEFDQRADALARGLRQLGLKPHDRVVVQLPNIAEFYLVCFALFRLGVIPVFALPAHRRTELAHFVSMSEAVAYITCDMDAAFDYRQMAREIQAQHPLLSHIIVQGEAQEFSALESLFLDGGPVDHITHPADVAFLQLSGGSTGLPKLIPRTHDDYAYSVRESAQLCALSENSVYLCALPAAHNFPLSSPGSFGVFYAGGCVVMVRHPAPEVCFPLIETERVTITALVPPIALLWLDSARRQPHDLSSLTLLQVGGARFAPEAAKRVRMELGCALQQVFGMAEGLVNYTRLEDGEYLTTHTQGYPLSPYDEIKIVDDGDCLVPPGEPGHLLTRGPYTIRGYYKAPEHNQRSFTDDGYYRTGDIVRRLATGHLIVEGRAKDQINRGGEKIDAAEVENHLMAHPSVRDVALVAMPDAWLGEKSCAFILPRSLDEKPRRQDLLVFLRARGIAAYKLPDRIEYLPQLPKTGVGKIDKRALRDSLTKTGVHP